VRDTKDQVDVDKDEDPSVTYAAQWLYWLTVSALRHLKFFPGAYRIMVAVLILGTQTYGKGSVQNAIDLDRVIRLAATR
jgi:carboxyl-terminal processing protease